MQSTTGTTLNLLTREGVVTFTFSPALTGDQYGELLAVIHQASSADELRAMARNCARRWQATLEVEY